jgi:ABC-type transport system involved in multi-copper enzyme maturation permease subunit
MTTETLTSMQTFRLRAAPRPSRFSDTLLSEWIKLTSVRSTYITLGLGIGLSILTTAIAMLAIPPDKWPSDVDARLFWLVGNIFTLIVFSVFGVLTATGEYSSGTIRLTLMATPRRGRVFAAKLLLTAGMTLIAGLIATAGMFAVAQLVNGGYSRPVVGVGDPGIARLILGMGLTMPFFPVIGLALGFLMRSAAAGITTVLGIIWLPVIFGETVPTWWRENIVSVLPGTAVDSFTIGHLIEDNAFQDPVVGMAIASAWLIVFVGAAYIAFLRRDA